MNDERGDAADVHACCLNGYSLAADAKAFRLSRTAKNQKDFKVQAMDGWRRDLDYAVVVCPIYQMPTQTSQIYQQAIVRNVCLLSYSHLSALVALAVKQNQKKAEEGLHEILKSLSYMQPSKNSVDYWTGLNRAFVNALGKDAITWKEEKIASVESLRILKEESLQHLRSEKMRLIKLTREQAISELIRMAGLESRIRYVENIEHGSLLEY